MTSMTDGRGTRTEYVVDDKGRRKSETIRDVSGNVQRQTLYTFDTFFPGRIYSKKVLSLDTNVMPDTLTHYYLGNSENGANPSWWREITEVTGQPDANNPDSIDPATCVSTTTVHDFDGRKLAVIDPRGYATEFAYDDAGRLREVIYPDLTQGTAADNPRKHLGYDLHGNLTSETDEMGTTTWHAYDDFNRRTSSTVDLNRNGVPETSYTGQGVDASTGAPTYNGDITTSATYNSRGQVLTQTDARGKVTTNVYDAHGRLMSTDDGGLETSYQYGINSGGSVFDTSGFKPTKVKSPNGLVTNITYDAMYRPLTKSSTAADGTSIGGTTTTVYDASGNPTSVTDPLQRTTSYLYDALGQCVKTTFPDNTPENLLDNTFVEQFYTHHGQVWKSINEMGAETVTTYDAIGRAVAVFQPSAAEGEDGAVTTTAYDAAGNVIRVTDPLGRVTYSTYDERNRPVSIHAPRVWDSVHGTFVWPETVTTYDDAGRVLSIKDHTGATVRKAYDAAGRVWKSTDPLNHDTFSTYDPNGNVLTVTDARNNTTTNTYDALNRLRITQDGEDIVNKFEYDAAGNRTKVVDGLNQETNFVYDLLGRLKSQTFANFDTWTYAYNSVHKLSQTDPNEVTTSYTYHDRGWLETSTAPGLARTYSYDDCGRLLSVVEDGRPQATVVNTYDALGRLKTETSRGVLHTYFYDLVGNRVRAEFGTGQVVETSYDALNRPETITQGGQMTRYGYDLAGRAVMLIGGNGQVTENTYDDAGRLKNRVLFRSLMEREQDDVMAEFGWAHDDVGNVVAQHEVWPGSADRAAGVRATTMTYDGANRLETETITDPEQGVIATAYAYDAANNRDTKTVTGGTEPGFWDYTYNDANQLTAWEKRSAPAGTLMKSATLGYDDNGNRTSQTVTEVATATTSVTAYHWDAQDRLSAVVMLDASEHSYDYDYRTRRTGTHETSTASAPKHTTIVFAGGLSLAEWEQSGTGLQPVGSVPPTVEYTRGPDMGGGVGGMLYSKRGEIHKYSLSNGRGDIVAQSDSGGELTWTASYEAYGKRTKETGVNADKQRANSKDEDPTGLLNEGFRYRDIETGVWLSRDPAGFVDGPNIYAFVKQNPWTGFDPDGLKVKENRVERRPVAEIGPAPKRTDFVPLNTKMSAKDRAAATTRYEEAKDNHVKLVKSAKENAEWNKQNSRVIEAWEQYDMIKNKMTGRSAAWDKMWSFLDSDTTSFLGKNIPLNVQINMIPGSTSVVPLAEIANGTAKVTINFGIDGLLKNPDSADNGLVSWHTVPHEFSHAVEKASVTPRVDPLGLGTVSRGDPAGWLARMDVGSNFIMTSEARAVRAGNIVSSQLGSNAFSTHYTGHNGSPVSVPDHLALDKP
jgi:RHS repeat-associated protein